jgi:uncharacterized membrane protein YfcA
VDLSPLTVILIACVFLFAGGVKGLIGVGLPTIAVALLINVMPLREAIPLVVVPAIVTNVWQALLGGRGLALLKRFWPMLLLACIGTWIGVGVLAGSNQLLLSVVFGAILVAYALMGLLRPVPPPPGRAEPWLTPVVGIINGIINGLTGSYILPGVLYLQALGLGRDELIQAMGFLFLVASGALGVSLAGQNVMGINQAALSGAALVPTLLGYFAGQTLRRGISEERFRKVFFIGLLCLGLYTVASRLIA